MVSIHQVSSDEELPLDALCELLADSVRGGASVGFLRPLSRETASRYWEQVAASLGQGLFLWVAEVDGTVVGSVQLAVCAKENGRHRAEIQKLFVHSAHRGKRISTQLMAEAESFSYFMGCTLLVLDTQAGSVAEAVYRRLGWSKAGEIPNFAASPDGKLHATAYYYKLKPA
jgi:GNAT superfamily N-acetyltransferase